MSRDARIRLGVDSGAYLDGTLSTAHGKMKRWGGKVAADISKSLRGAFSGLGDIAGFAGIAGIAAMARETFKWNTRLVQLQQTTGFTRVKILQMNDAIQKTAVATGASQEELLAGIETYQAITGKADEYIGALDDVAKIQKATNANGQDLARTMAALSLNLGVTKDQFMEIFDVLSVQGDKGAIEFKGIAAVFPKLTAHMARFGATGVHAAVWLGAALQTVRAGAGDDAEAATQLDDLLGGMEMHAKKLRAAGIEIYSDKEHTKLKEAGEIIEQILKLPPDKLGEILGNRKEPLAALASIRLHHDLLVEQIALEGQHGAILQKNAIYQQSATAAFDKFKATMASAFLKNVELITTMLEKAIALGQYLAAHPMLAVSAFAALKFGGGGGGIIGRLGGAGGFGGGAGGAALSLIQGGTPVYVVNMGPGGMGGAGAPGAPGAVPGVVARTGLFGKPSLGAYAGGAIGVATGLPKIIAGEELGVSDIAAGTLGGLTVGGPWGAATAFAGIGGEWLGQHMYGPDAYGGGKSSVSQFDKYGQYSEDSARTAFYGPGTTVDEARGRDMLESSWFGGGLDQSGHPTTGPNAPGSGRQAFGDVAGDSSAMEWAAMQRSIIDLNATMAGLLTQTIAQADAATAANAKGMEVAVRIFGTDKITSAIADSMHSDPKARKGNK